MSKLREKSRFVLDIFIFILLYIGSLSAVTYLNSSNVFDAHITYVNNDKMPYSVYLEIENIVDSELKYFIEVVYEKENLVSGEEKIECDGKCELKIPLKKIFFDNYEVIIRTEYEDKHYEKKLSFNLEKKETQDKVNIEPLYYLTRDNLENFSISGDLYLEHESDVIMQVAHSSGNEFRYETKFFCNKSCEFTIPFNKSILFGEYIMAIYLPYDMFTQKFEISLSDVLINETVAEQKEQIENHTYNFDTDFNFLINRSQVNEIDFDRDEFILSSLFYNDYITKTGTNTEKGYKANFFAHFNVSNYAIIYENGISASIRKSNLSINGNPNEENLVIITKKEYIPVIENSSEYSKEFIHDLFMDSVILSFVTSREEVLPKNLKNKVIEKDKKLYYRTNLPQKFSKNDYAFEINVDRQELDELSNIENEMLNVMDRISDDTKSKRVAEYIKSKKGRIDGTLKFSGNDIEFKGLAVDETGIDLKAKKLNKRFVEQKNKKILSDIFAIDPSRLEYETAIIKKIAKGDALYKCKDWSYDTDECLGTWKKIMDLVPGEEYEINLEPKDPAFAESNIIFSDDMEPGGALWMGLWSAITESDSTLSGKWGIDSQYKRSGSYSLGDSPGVGYSPAVPADRVVPHISIITPALNLSGLSQANATYYHRMYLEPDGANACYDAVFPLISTDGFTWDYITIGGYTQRTFSNWFAQPRSEAAADGFAICGQYLSWQRVTIDLTPYVGNDNVYLKWAMTADDNTGFEGYNMDDFTVYGTENVKPNVTSAPFFDPTVIASGESTRLSVNVTDDAEFTVIGTMSFSNGTVSNYTLNPEIKSKEIIYDILDSPVTELGDNVTILSDSFSTSINWFRTIGNNMNDWDIDAGRLHCDALTDPPQYVTLVPPRDLRNYSRGFVSHQYYELGSWEGSDCMGYSLYDGSLWSANTDIFCNDLNSSALTNNVPLSSAYMSKNFQFRFYGTQGASDEDGYIDNFNLYAWHEESKTLGRVFGPITNDNYTDISKITVTITVDSYNPESSVANANNDPDLFLAVNNGTSDDEYEYIADFGLEAVYTGNGFDGTDRTFSIAITDSTILESFKSNPQKRYIRIGAEDLDYTSVGTQDEIVFKDVKVTLRGNGTNDVFYYNFTNFLLPGTQDLSHIYAIDQFGNSEVKTFTDVNFSVESNSILFAAYLSRNNIYMGESTTMLCQVADNTTKNGISGYTVNFYINDTLLGSNITDGIGWAKYSFADSSGFPSNTIIKCNISDEPSLYYSAVDPVEMNDSLNVWELSADTTKPEIFAGGGTPESTNVGFGFNAYVNASDNKKVSRVWFYVKRPGEFFYNKFPMSGPGTSTGAGQWTYNYIADSVEGTYSYYFRVEDNWTVPNWNITGIKTFYREVSDALIGIRNDQPVYKTINDVSIIPYVKSSISNSSVSEHSAYIGGHVIFNNSFADSLLSWTYNNCQGNKCLYSGAGGAGYENFDIDTGGSAQSHTPGTDNSGVRFSMESGTYSAGGIDYAFIEKTLNLSGYDEAQVEFYYADNDVETMVNGDYPLSFDIYDGTWYQDYTVQGSNNGDTNIVSGDYNQVVRDITPYNLIDEFKIRFSGGGTESSADSFAIDDVLVTGNVIDKTSISHDYTLGNNDLDLAFFNITVRVTAYDNRGSVSNSEPDISIELWNGSSFVAKNYCNLNKLYGFNQSSSDADLDCEIMITDRDVVKAWERGVNRILRVNGDYIDVSSSGADNINWTYVRMDYFTPSLIYNPSETLNLSVYLTNRIYRNGSEELKGVVNLTDITLNTKSLYNLTESWNAANLPLTPLPNGIYYSSSALTDGAGNILKDSRGDEIESTDYFEIQNLYVNITSPNSSEYNVSIWVNVTLDTTYYASGGWCAYSVNGNPNVSMTQMNSSHFSNTILLNNFTDYENDVVVYCNDSLGDVVVSDTIDFWVFKGMSVFFTPPTEPDGVAVNRTWTYVNATVDNTRETSGYIDFNGTVLGYWPFENYTGVKVQDFSIYEMNATISGGAFVESDDGVRGNYIELDGSDDYVELPSTIVSNDSYSISMWLKPFSDISSSPSSDLYLYEAQSIAGPDNYLYFSSTGDGSINFRTNNGTSDSYLQTQLNDWNSTSWNHVVATYNAQTSQKRIYVNGILENSSIHENMKLGSDWWHGAGALGGAAGSFRFNGSMDEIQIHNRALQPQEVRALYNSKVNILEANITNIKNGNYTYKACAIDEKGVHKCDMRDIFINKTLPLITITSPLNSSKYDYLSKVYMNVTTNKQAADIWCQFNEDGTLYHLANTTLFDWTSDIAPFVGKYNITCSGEDEVGNILSPVVNYFYVISNKNMIINKSITNIDNMTYLVHISLYNAGEYPKAKIIDFVDEAWGYSGFSVSPDEISAISGSGYNGIFFRWNITIPSMAKTNLYYYLNNTNNVTNSSLVKNFIVGLE